MTSFINLLAENQLLLLFTVIGIGYLIGHLKFFGFSLGITAVLFVGMTFSAIDPRLVLPDYIYVLGLVLFVYAIGLQAGPSFFSSFGKHGLKSNLFALLVIAGSALVAVLISYITGMQSSVISGVYCGALTNAPALAASIETVKSLTASLPQAMRDMYVNNFVVTFGLAYPFGVLGLILWFYVFIKVFKVDLGKEEEDRLKAEGTGKIISETFKVMNPAAINKTVQDIMETHDKPGFVLSRIKNKEGIFVVTPTMVLKENDEIEVIYFMGGGSLGI